MRLHLDTDLGGDPDDACALAMLLGWPEVEVAGITTNLDADGQRAACAAHVLALAGRSDIPVAAGAGASLTTLERYPSTAGDERYWPEPVPSRPPAPGHAFELLQSSIDGAATIVAIGAFTNLALLEICRPGSLHGARVVAMAGWIRAPAADFPRWGPEMDFNTQCDTRAAEIVFDAGADLTLVTLPAAMRAPLRARDLPRLRAAGRVGALLARQAEAYWIDADRASLAAAHPGLPDDLVNFHWDPVTCAVAAGWPGATREALELAVAVEGGVLRFVEARRGRTVSVVTDVDGAGFADAFLGCVESAAVS